jgi:hypothetical protein
MHLCATQTASSPLTDSHVVHKAADHTCVEAGPTKRSTGEIFAQQVFLTDNGYEKVETTRTGLCLGPRWHIPRTIKQRKNMIF